MPKVTGPVCSREGSFIPDLLSTADTHTHTHTQTLGALLSTQQRAIRQVRDTAGLSLSVSQHTALPG